MAQAPAPAPATTSYGCAACGADLNLSSAHLYPAGVYFEAGNKGTLSFSWADAKPNFPIPFTMISPRPSLSSGFFSRSASFSRPASFSPSPPPSPLPQAPPLLSAPAPFSRAASFSRSASGTAVAAPDHASCFYDVLGLQAGASYEEIKAAYRRLARAVHPDVAPHASADDFIRVQAAYSTLSDPSKRADYDRRVVVPSAVGRRRAPSLARSPSFPGFRRRTWETDQCW